MEEGNKFSRNIKTPNWAEEAIFTDRPLWEVAAMAGNVEPKLLAVKNKKSADPEWKEEYEKRVRVMKLALISKPSNSANHIYYNPDLAGNSTLILNPLNFRKVRVEVKSAIEFLWNKFGKDFFPEGLQEIHQKLSQQGVTAANQASAESEREYTAPVDKGTAHRDQKLANATKELKRLQVLAYVFSRELYSGKQDSDFPAASLKEDWLAAIEEAGLKGRPGFGPDGVETLIEKCFKSYSELKKIP